MKLRALLVLTCIICAVGLVASGSDVYGLRQTVDRGDPIAQPNYWVSFDATITRTLIDGRVISGRFFRGNDGSELSVEYDRRSTGTVTIRHITNYEEGRYYHSSRPGEWNAGPLDTSGPRKQRRFFTRSPGVTAYRAKLSLLEGQDGSLLAMEGLDAWLVTNNEGAVHVLAPALNFATVVTASLDGQRRVLSNIRIGAVPASTFRPAAGDTVTFVSESFRPPVAQPKR